MNIAIDLILAAIVGFCVWRGYRSGLIRGICGILALVISVFVSNVVATAYSGEFTGMLKPFVSGVVDTVITDLINPDSDDTGTGDVGETVLKDGVTDDDGVFSIAYSALRTIGLMPNAAKSVAGMSVSEGDSGMSVGGISNDISDKLTAVLAYVAVFGICFILIAIIFAVIGNLIDFVFALPGLELLDSILGAAFGLARGLIVVLVIAVIARYIGLVAAPIIEKTVFLKYIVNVNPIASILGI